MKNLIRKLQSRFDNSELLTGPFSPWSAIRKIFRTKRPFKLTSAGWVFILYTIGVGAGAINTGNNLLYLVFGVFLGLILASGLLSDLSLWGLSVEWSFPKAGEAGQPVAIFLKITNHKKWLPSVSVSVGMEGTLRGRPVALKVYVPFINAGQSVSARLEFTPERRGWFQRTRLRLYTRYPFALLEKWWRVNQEESIANPVVGDPENGFFATPRTVDVDWGDVSTQAVEEISAASAEQRGEGSTFFGIRPFRAGDNPRRIHWKSSAKQPVGLLLREMESERAFNLMLRCPSPEEVRKAGSVDVEQMVAFFASVVRSFESEGHRAYLWIGNGLVDEPEEFLALWDPLAPLDSITSRWVSSEVLASRLQEVDGLESYRRWVEASR